MVVPLPASAGERALGRAGAIHRRARLRPVTAGGFTLIELVVILLLLTVILGMVGINLTRNDADLLKEEGDRLALLLQSAQEEAIMQARAYAFAPAADGYRFLRMDERGKLKPIATGDLLSPRQLTARVSVAGLVLDGVAEIKDPLIVFDPSGLAPVFTITLQAGDTPWYVHGEVDGSVYSSPSPEPNAA